MRLLEHEVRGAGEQIPPESRVIRHAAAIVPYAIVALEEVAALASSDLFPESFRLCVGSPALTVDTTCEFVLSLCVLRSKTSSTRPSLGGTICTGSRLCQRGSPGASGRSFSI